jgi:hypothetical protein
MRFHPIPIRLTLNARKLNAFVLERRGRSVVTHCSKYACFTLANEASVPPKLQLWQLIQNGFTHKYLISRLYFIFNIFDTYVAYNNIY